MLKTTIADQGPLK
jgi:hypothetical protein